MRTDFKHATNAFLPLGFLMRLHQTLHPLGDTIQSISNSNSANGSPEVSGDTQTFRQHSAGGLRRQWWPQCSQSAVPDCSE